MVDTYQFQGSDHTNVCYSHLQYLVGAGGGDLNTSVVHMCDQRFSKHILIEICPYEEKHPKQEFECVFHTQFYL